MSPHTLARILLVCLGAHILFAGDIQGVIVIKRKLTRRNVTPTAGLYQRGVMVPAVSDQGTDPLAFERSHVAVYLEGPGARSGSSSEMAQKERRFSPDMLVVPAGTTVSFPNLDPIFHNVFSLSKPKSFDLGNYPQDHTRRIDFTKPGIVFVNCHLHPNMTGVIVVTPNEWSAKVDDAGHFRLADVAPGKYTIVAWHKTAGFFRETIAVPAHGATDIQFFIPLDAEPGGTK